MSETKPGGMYARDWAGRLRPAVTPGPPEVVTCRRVADYAPAAVPGRAMLGKCTRCAALIAFDGDGPWPTVPRICLQCAGIEPLPFPG